MLELAALGALLREPMHGYRLKEWLEHYMGTVLTANFGAIYPLLRRLEQRGLIRRNTAGGPRRTVYEITEAGRAHWLQLMLETQNDSWLNARARFMTRLWFSTHLTPEQRRCLLEQRLLACHARQQSSFETPREEIQQRMRGYAMDKLALEISWLEGLLANEPDSDEPALGRAVE